MAARQLSTKFLKVSIMEISSIDQTMQPKVFSQNICPFIYTMFLPVIFIEVYLGARFMFQSGADNQILMSLQLGKGAEKIPVYLLVLMQFFKISILVHYFLLSSRGGCSSVLSS